MSSSTEALLKEKIVSCLTQQLSELELLKSMYPKKDEIILTDTKAVEDIQNFINNKSDYTPNHLDFILYLFLNDLKLEFCVNLPSFYPDEEPDIYIRCNQLNRQQETRLNLEISNYIKSYFIREVFLYTVISWLQENITIFSSEIASNYVKESDEIINIPEDKFVRLWIYSHHIYNKKKREEIVKQAKNLKLTGFCLPGKPGIVCIEGADSDCKEWWRVIKAMCWKKIIIKKTEVFEPTEKNQHQKFIKFEEIHFQNSSSRHSKHADMSGFSKFMEERGLTQIFNDFFGLGNDPDPS